MKNLFPVLATLLILATAACAPQMDTEADVAGIRTLLDEVVAAENASDVDAMMVLMTDDVVIMPANQKPIIGQDAVRAWWENFFSRFSIEGAVSDEEIQAGGEWGFIRGTWNVTTTAKEGGEPQESSYSFIVVVHREADGTWKEARGIWHSDQPATTE
jgi:uncharacterized protein (TIGR02246 family)